MQGLVQPFSTPYVRTTAAARYVGISPRTLQNLRHTGGGPRFSRVRRTVIYAVVDLDRWIAEHKVENDREPP